MMPKTETSGDDAAEKWSWSTVVNWEEDPAVKAKHRRQNSHCLLKTSSL